MNRLTPRCRYAAAALAAAGMLAAGCSAFEPSSAHLDRNTDAPVLSGALETFASCESALSELQDAAAKHVNHRMFSGGEATAEDVAPNDSDEQAEAGAESDDGAAPRQDEGDSDQDHSDTNVHEAGIDEPDIVKTDGDRILALSNGSLHVVDPVSATVESTLDLQAELEAAEGGRQEMLWDGDRVLIIAESSFPTPEPAEPDDAVSDFDGPVNTGTTLLLADVSGDPQVLNTFELDGVHVDSRAVGETTRIVVRSTPDLPSPQLRDGADPFSTARQAIEQTTIEDWMPRYILDGDEDQVPCGAMSRPAHYSATSMLTVFTFDLQAGLDDGSPVTVAADGDIVYGTDEALYIANDRSQFLADQWELEDPVTAETELYRFAVDEQGPPNFDSSASVPGHLLNQYSMSEHDGHLRVATTEEPFAVSDDPDEVSSSTMYVLSVDDGLEEVGSVGDMGPDERIYSVRYVDDKAYVVTFRETDPLYTLDLSDPSTPTVEGELKITGYSAYLHPLSFERLIGVGQEATEDGIATGAQVSLFDVGDPEAPTRLDEHHLPGASTAAEFDPHAFLYWPDRSLLVLPTSDYESSTALLLNVGNDSLSEAGSITHDEAAAEQAYIMRSLIIGDTLWTMSPGGLKATDLDDTEDSTWVSFE